MKRLSDYSFGRIKVGEVHYTSDLIVFEDEAWPPWVREKGHLLTLDDVQWALERSPDVIIVGTGSLKTAPAVEAYNKRTKEGERVAACLHLTC